MLPGILKDRIDIYNELTEKKALGRALSYQYSFYDRAQVLFSNAAERQNNGALESPGKTMLFRVRFHLTRYTERQLIKWRNDFYNIRGINPDTDRDFQILIGERTPLNSLVIVPVETPTEPDPEPEPEPIEP